MTGESHKRLGSIVTLWSVVRRAHADDAEISDADDNTRRLAQEELLQRYGGAVRRYLLAALKEEDAADEVFQEFALRFVRGDFCRADKERGRFRSFLKTVVYHLICDYQNGKRKKREDLELNPEILDPGQLQAPPPETEQDFARSWREEVFERAWKSLQQREARTGTPYFTSLRLRSELPKLRSPELAAEVSKRLSKPTSAASLRQTIHRARTYFAEDLVDQVSQSLVDANPEAIQEELADLGLLEYCRTSLEQGGGTPEA
jgi:RNA polymerase sigma-70 factor (ECF subfamily)